MSKISKIFHFLFFFFIVLFVCFLLLGWGGKKNMAIVEMLQSKYKNIDQMGIASAVKS